MLKLLPTKHNKLTPQWNGPYVVKEVVKRMYYKVEVKGKTKIYHANLLEQYFERDENVTSAAVQVNAYTVEVAVLGEELEDGEELDDANLLELCSLPCKESYTDVNISET